MTVQVESFRLMGETSEHRVGVRSEGGSEEIEVLLRLCPPSSHLDVGRARSALACLEVLASKGYELTAQDGWWVVGGKAVAGGKAEEEGRAVLALLSGLPTKDPEDDDQ
jgi:hypothetical protein